MGINMKAIEYLFIKISRGGDQETLGYFAGLNTMLFLSTVAVLAVSSYAMYIYYWRPLRIRKALLQQGFVVLPYHPIAGDVPELKHLEAQAQLSEITSPAHEHPLAPYILPFYDKLLSQHPGSRVVYWWGSLPEFVLSKADDARRILSGDINYMHKLKSFIRVFKKLWGHGLLLAEGNDWHLQRNILRRAFFAEKLKVLVADMATNSLIMIQAWKMHFDKENLASEVEIEVAHDLKKVTAEILLRTMFSSSYLKAKSVFERQETLLEMTNKLRIRIITIPFYEYLPTDLNRKMRALDKRNKQELAEIIEERKRTAAAAAAAESIGSGCSYGSDLLGLILDAQAEEAKLGRKGAHLSLQHVVDQCKTFFFAGHDTTALLLDWTLVLLSLNQGWQEKARQEVWDVCGKQGEPNADHLRELKVVGMILNESLRLYPPIPVYGRRKLFQQVQIDDGTLLPRGTGVVLPCLYLHRDKEVWGEDADEFRPDRFAKGVSQACKNPNAYVPFGFGPRTCIGQHYALMEAKVILAVILQNFAFRLSPKYHHAPLAELAMRPKHGVHLLLRSLLKT